MLTALFFSGTDRTPHPTLRRSQLRPTLLPFSLRRSLPGRSSSRSCCSPLRLPCGKEGFGLAAVGLNLALQLFDRGKLALFTQPAQQPNPQLPAV